MSGRKEGISVCLEDHLHKPLEEQSTGSLGHRFARDYAPRNKGGENLKNFITREKSRRVENGRGGVRNQKEGNLIKRAWGVTASGGKILLTKQLERKSAPITTKDQGMREKKEKGEKEPESNRNSGCRYMGERWGRTKGAGVSTRD